MYLTYSGSFGRMRERYFQRILERLSLRPGAKVLDYGCGPGDFLLVAKARGFDVSGIDNSPRSVQMAAERGLPVICGGTRELLGRPERYDAILAQSVLEHVPDGVALVTALGSLLAPGGVLVLSAPTPGAFFWDDPTHVRPYTAKSFAILADLTGMRCEYLGYVFAFLLGIELRAPIFFQLMNLLPLSLGSNLVAFLRRAA